VAVELAGRFAEVGQCGFMAHLAEPYAARVIAAMLGIPEHEWPVIARDSATLGLATGVRIREDLPRIEAALGRLYAYADAQIADRRARPRDDCVTALVTAHAPRTRLAPPDLRATRGRLLSAGSNPTRTQPGRPM